MRTQPWVLASAFALVASVASAQPERPRIYYPRAVKRQIGNATTEELPEPASTTTIQSSTRRGLLDDLLDDVLGGDSTTSARSKSTSSDDDDDDDETTEGGIIIGPTGIVIPGLDPKPTKTSDSESDSSTGTPSKTPSASASASKSASESSSRSSSSSSSTKLIDLDPIISDILPEPTTTNGTEESTAASTTASGSSASSSSSSGLIDDLTTLLPPVSETSSGAEETSTTVDDTPTSSSTFEPPVTPTPEPIPSSSTETEPPASTDVSSDIPSGTSEPPLESTTTSDLPIETPVTPLPSSSETTELPVTNTTDVTDATEPATEDPSTASETSVDEPVATPTSVESEPPALTTPVPEPTTLTKVPPTKPATIADPEPTETGNDQDNWLPSTIVQEATSFSFERPTAEPTGTATVIPSNVPKVILPDEPDIEQPEGTTAIQIGFLYPLNWLFVSKSGVAAAQVFKWLPEALSYAGEFPTNNVVVTKLVPLDTNSKWGYMTTIAKVYFPTSHLDGLQMQLGAANSRLYNNEKSIVNSLTANINRNIDLFGNIGEENGDANRGGDDSGNNSDDTFDDNDDGKTTAEDRARTAGIAVGALSLAGLYGAAMFIVARRYKRKRQGHQRASSLTSSQASSEMRYTGAGSPALMGGALLSRDVSSYGGLAAGGRDSHGSGQSGAGNSARTAGISAPVATENSLGWN